MSTTVTVWLQDTWFPHASVADHVRRTLKSAGQRGLATLVTVLDTLTVRPPPAHPVAAVGGSKLQASPHSATRSGEQSRVSCARPSMVVSAKRVAKIRVLIATCRPLLITMTRKHLVRSADDGGVLPIEFNRVRPWAHLDRKSSRVWQNLGCGAAVANAFTSIARTGRHGRSRHPARAGT